MSMEESTHVTFDEANPKSLVVEVCDCAGILEKILLENKDSNEDKNQIEDKDKDQSGDKINDQVEEESKDNHQDLHKKRRTI